LNDYKQAVMIRSYILQNNTNSDETVKFELFGNPDECNFYLPLSTMTGVVKKEDKRVIINLIKKDPTKDWGEYHYKVALGP